MGVSEIRHSLALRIYGAALALTHVLTAWSWTHEKKVVPLLSSRDAICWPFFEACASLRPFDADIVGAVLVVYALAALLSALAFARWVTLAFVLLAFVNLLKAALLVQDYHLMGNYHYMQFAISFAFIVLPNKRDVCRLLLVGFYVAAGSIKLNAEWLTGAALIRPPVLSGVWLQAACAYVVVLELCMVFGVLSSRTWLRWLTLAQLFAFHAFSWHIVGYFYPCMMALLLVLLPVVGSARVVWAPSTIAALCVFAFAQLVPKLFPGDSAITGEGRLFALNMLDAKTDCDLKMIVRRGDSVREYTALRNELGVRTRCDPVVYFSMLREACASSDHVSLYLNSKRATDSAMRSVIALEDACSAAQTYDLWRHNDWIVSGGNPD